ncbi:MAG: hypothetical protein AAF748_08460, partial [Pseudomonadota bacterium]
MVSPPLRRSKTPHQYVQKMDERCSVRERSATGAAIGAQSVVSVTCETEKRIELCRLNGIARLSGPERADIAPRFSIAQLFSAMVAPDPIGGAVSFGGRYMQAPMSNPTP